MVKVKVFICSKEIEVYTKPKNRAMNPVSLLHCPTVLLTSCALGSNIFAGSDVHSPHTE